MKSDFYDWKRHPITQVIMSEFNARIKLISESIVTKTATADPRELAELAGMVKAYTSIIDIQVEEVEETQNGN